MAKSNTRSAPSTILIDIAHAPSDLCRLLFPVKIFVTLPLAHTFPSEAVTLQLNCCVPLFLPHIRYRVLHQNGHYKRRCEIHHSQLVHLHNSQGRSMLYPYLFSLCWILTNSVNLPLLFLKD